MGIYQQEGKAEGHKRSVTKGNRKWERRGAETKMLLRMALRGGV